MPRRRLTLLALLSLLAFVAIAFTWPLTHNRPALSVRLTTPAPGKARFLVLGHGGVYFVTLELSQPHDGAWTSELTSYGGMKSAPATPR